VRDDQFVFRGESRERARGAAHVVLLRFERRGLTAAEEGVSAEGDDDLHDETPRVAPRWMLDFMPMRIKTAIGSRDQNARV
jgi:hypothetical protein